MTYIFSMSRSCFFGFVGSLPLMMAACDGAEIGASEWEGVWQSRGYGRIVHVTGDRARLIEQTGVSCLKTGDGALERLPGQLVGTPDLESGIVTVGNDATLSTITYDRRGEGGLEQLCPGGLISRDEDPELNFEVLWQTFDQHYAFFDERGVDWQILYQRMRPQIAKDTSGGELAKAFEIMLEEIGDAHVSLYADGRDVVTVGTRPGARLATECRERLGGACNVRRYIKERYRAAEALQKDNYLGGRGRAALGGDALWGQIDGSTGYFRIDSMDGLASGDYSARNDLAAIEAALDDMLEDLGHLPAMIVDVRLNGGGHDTVAVAIANRFADKRRIFGSKRAFFSGGTLPPQDLVVEPAEEKRRYQGAVAVLTSGETASAAEIFVMAMRALPHVTLIGEATEGILSDELYRTLPNGWEFSLSNEIYLAHDGVLFEAIGVPPDIEVPFLPADDLERDLDRGIDVALAELEARSLPGEKSQ